MPAPHPVFGQALEGVPVTAGGAPVYGGAQMWGPAKDQDKMYFTPPKYVQQLMPIVRSRPIDAGTLCLNVFVPWGMFCAVFAARCMSVRYTYPQVSTAACGLGLLLILLMARWAYKLHTRPDLMIFAPSMPFWSKFATLLLAAAWIAGFFMGDMNFNFNFQPYYDVTNLESYPNVDPSVMNGQQVMDAGQVGFVSGVSVDTSKSMGFYNLEWYCVAPIIKDAVRTPSHDFWAVGTNCCGGPSTEPTKFTCGEYNNPTAQAGLRLMKDSERPFFRLAVQQAEAKYNIKASHPLFFYFMQDPSAELNAYRDDGNKYLLLGFAGYFAVNLGAVILAVLYIFCHKAHGHH